MIIAIDFDGTCVTHDFPRVGKNIGAEFVLRELVANGHQLILFTMRSDVTDPQAKDPEIHAVSGNYLSDALKWFQTHKIPLYGINTNPTQHTWTSSPKAYANLYIGDEALGCPLTMKYDGYAAPVTARPFVDWIKVRKILVAMRIVR